MYIASPWGIWLSSDFRVSMQRPGCPPEPRLDHWSPKYASVTTGNEFTVVLTYTGIAEVVAVKPRLFNIDPNANTDPVEAALRDAGKRLRVDVSEWMLWTLAGESRTLDEVLHHIATEASKVPEFKCRDHVFMGGCVGPNGEGWVFFIDLLSTGRSFVERFQARLDEHQRSQESGGIE
jgi:hypothetical protein